MYHIKIRILPKASTNQFSLFQLILDNKKRENSSAIDNIFITQTPPETVFSAATDLIFSLETFKKLKTVLYWNSLWPIDLLESFQSDSGNGLVINTTDLPRGGKSFQQKNVKIGEDLQVRKSNIFRAKEGRVVLHTLGNTNKCIQSKQQMKS